MTEAVDSLVNGVPAGVLPVTDRGLQFGDGVFETIAVRDGRPVWLRDHLDRLHEACQRLRFRRSPDLPQLEQEAMQLCRGQDEAVLKIIVTRGCSGSGYRTADGEPNRILLLNEGSRHNAIVARVGIEAGICQQRLGVNPTLAGIKHLNRLEQVLGRMECEGRWQEGLMRDPEDNIVEGTMSNLFLVSGDRLVTPSLARAGVEGITRARILAIARRMGIHCDIRDVSADELATIDGMFVCNSLIGIWPVTRFEGRSLPIGDLTGELQQRLLESMCAEH